MAVCFIMLGLLTGCGRLLDLTPWESDNNKPEDAAPSTLAEATTTYSLAMGGVVEGRDELVLYDSDGKVRDFGGKMVTFQGEGDVVELKSRPEFNGFAEGSGALLVPKKVGTAEIKYLVDGVLQDVTYRVIVPPQSLIQILMGEARGQINGEAQVVDGTVLLTSNSPTASAIGAVVRNRVQLIETGQPTSLFIVDETDWAANPPESHWDAVIVANDNGFYQFTPVNPESASNTSFINARNRLTVDSEELVAYDQAVITAAGIFSNAISDPTGGAFAFRSPNDIETACLVEELISGATELSLVCGPGDEDFPAFAPVQILIHPSVALVDDTRPSFVFYRNRTEEEVAVTNKP